MIAIHPVLEGKNQRRIEPSHRKPSLQQGQSERVSQFPTDAVGTRETSAQTRQGLTKARSTQANREYHAARDGAGPVDVRGALGVIDARIGGMEGSGVSGDGIDGIMSKYRSRLPRYCAKL